jgi:glycosyltransferase involved in cell wall biosynthesis
MHAAVRMVMQLRPADGGPAAIDFVYDNAAWGRTSPKLSVAIPTFRTDASPLIDALAACQRANEIEIVVHDDGTRDNDLTYRMESAAERASIPVRIVSATANRGRSGARNQALRHAHAPWVLMLDSDMLPDTPDFIANYLAALAKLPKAVIVGGYSLKQASNLPRFALHRWQAAVSECLSADARSHDPARHVFTSNVAAHRDILDAYPFDEAFAGWGWEDVDWGLRVSKDFPIVHIDNTATHLGLDDDEALLGKYTRSARNFALVAGRHPETMQATPLFRAASFAKKLPLRPAFAALARGTALNPKLPVALRGNALKLARAIAYGEAL